MESRTIAMLGGGQLGKMTAEAAHRLGHKVVALDPSPHCPCAGLVDKLLIGDFKDPAQVLKLADEKPAVVTVEIEHINVASLKQLQALGITVIPSPETIEVIQDKFVQKQRLVEKGIEVAPFLEITDLKSAEEAGKRLGFPLVLKRRRLAYDGRGNFVARTAEDIPTAFQKLGGSELYAEKFVRREIGDSGRKIATEGYGLTIDAVQIEFTKELAIMVTMNKKAGKISVFPTVETTHVKSICHTVLAPAKITPSAASLARTVAESTAECFGGLGTYGIEMFLTESGAVLVNEVAPRPHNSGHYSIEACVTSQYEQHVRLITGMPFGDSSLKVKAAGMLNVLGHSTGDRDQTLAPLERALTMKGAAVHWYGKKDIFPERKLGHITVVGATRSDVERSLASLQGKDLPAVEPLIGVIMGSDSDLPKMAPGIAILRDFGVPFEVRIVSAHRTPEYMVEYAKAAHTRGLVCIIAGAGGAAHLPGMVASMTPLPVIGVPVNATTLSGKDALYSIVQMPRGVPVATVAIDNSDNAALLALRMVGMFDRTVQDKMLEFQVAQEKKVREKDANLKL